MLRKLEKISYGKIIGKNILGPKIFVCVFVSVYRKYIVGCRGASQLGGVTSRDPPKGIRLIKF